MVIECNIEHWRLWTWEAFGGQKDWIEMFWYKFCHIVSNIEEGRGKKEVIDTKWECFPFSKSSILLTGQRNSEE